MSLIEWLKEWLAVYKSPYLKIESIKRIKVSIKNHIPEWLKQTDLKDLTAFKIDKALSECRLSRSRKYAYYILHNALHRAYCLDLINDNLAEKINLIKHRQKRGNALTRSEQTAFIIALQRCKYKNALLFLLFSGVRRGELALIKFSDVSFKDNLIRVNGTKTETSNRYIILTEDLKNIILEQRKAVDGYFIFPYSSDILTRTFKRLCPTHKLHDLRHTYITRCAESGININVTQYIVGHKSLNTTLSIYTHVTFDFIKDDLQKLKI